MMAGSTADFSARKTKMASGTPGPCPSQVHAQRSQGIGGGLITEARAVQVTILHPPHGLTWSRFLESSGEEVVRNYWQLYRGVRDAEWKQPAPRG
jgi:hypothetical protein